MTVEIEAEVEVEVDVDGRVRQWFSSVSYLPTYLRSHLYPNSTSKLPLTNPDSRSLVSNL